MTTRLTTRGLTLTLVGFIATPAFAAGFAFGGGAPTATATVAPRQHAYWMDRDCKYEDSNNCYWDGGDHSFYAHKIEDITCIMYTNKKFAAKNDYCFKN